MAPEIKKVPAVFYRSPAGAEPVRDWIVSLSSEDRRIVGFDLALVEFGWPVGMPLCRAIGRDLWEVRSHLTGGRIARVIFSIDRGRMVLLHGFIKKTQRTPARELDVAHRRRKEFEHE